MNRGDVLFAPIKHLSAASISTIIAFSCISPALAEISAADAKAGIVECTADVLKDHNPGLADNPDRVIRFQAYISNFNSGCDKQKADVN